MIPNPAGDYSFLPGIDAYSSGVAAREGHAIVHATLGAQLPWRRGFDAILEFLADRGRPAAALCGIELRCPAPMSFSDFAEFNVGYHRKVTQAGLLVDRHNPIARTNVAPRYFAPGDIVLHGFSFTEPAAAGHRHTWVTAGAGELVEDELDRRSVVRAGERSPEAMAEKARHVLATMRKRITALGSNWLEATTIDVYTVVDPAHVTRVAIVPEVGAASSKGLHWFPAAPPVDTLDFEMDVRGVATEIAVDLG